jgi:hypothetical protein
MSTRKYDYGATKRDKRKRLEAAAQSQRGALDRFIVRDSQINSQNQTRSGSIDDGHGDDEVLVEDQIVDETGDTNIEDESGDPNIVDASDDPNIGDEGNNNNIADDINNS